MIDVTTAIEVEWLLQRYELFDIADGERFSLLLHQVVQVGNVGSVMSSIVEVNDLAAHDWLERAHLVWQVLELDAGELGWGSSSGATHTFLDQVVQHVSTNVCLCNMSLSLPKTKTRKI